MSKERSLCVYCGSSNKAPSQHMAAAFGLGQLMGRAKIGLIYGGGRIGLMGRVADGVLAEGGRVTGIIPEHLHLREVAHHAVDELLVVDSMHERKRLMAERADGFVVLPGGYGTLDEMFEIITWRQLQLHDKPIILVDLEDYWQPLVAMMARILAEGYAAPNCARLMTRVQTIEEVLPAFEAAPLSEMPLASKLL